jgi:hypothetical protein
MGACRRSLLPPKRLYFERIKSKTCTVYAPGSATKTRCLESVATADGACNASTRVVGSAGPAMMSRVSFRRGCSALTSSADENTRTKLRLAEFSGTPVCAGCKEVAKVTRQAAARLGMRLRTKIPERTPGQSLPQIRCENTSRLPSTEEHKPINTIFTRFAVPLTVAGALGIMRAGTRT